MYNQKYINELVAMLAILSQINLKTDRFFLNNDSDIEKHYSTLRKRIIAWFVVCNAKPEIDDQQ